MKRSQRIGALADLEQHESDHAARALAESQRVLREREAVLAELSRYREDYAGGRVLSSTHNIVAFQDYQRFLVRLDEAILHQSRLVAESHVACDVHRDDWMTARGRVASLDKVVERCARVEQRTEARREQRHLDEAGSRMSIRGARREGD